MAKKVLNGNKDGNGFDKNPQNINRNGRPRKLIGTVNAELEAKGIKAASKDEIVNCYLRLVNTDIDELKEIIKDKDQPAMIIIVGKAILSGKGFDIIEKMLDRGIGKPLQSTDITTNGNEINISPIEWVKQK